MRDDEMMQLYSRRILALTASISHQGRLDNPQGSAMRRSPQCGSSVTVDVDLADGAISAFSQEVRACALGQASASVLGANVLGLNRAQIAAGRDQLDDMLKRDGPAPTAPFADLEALKPARAFPNRHASILLAWEAVLAAIDAALEQAE